MGFPWSYRLLSNDNFSFKSEPHLTPPRNPTGAVVTSPPFHRTPRTWWKRAELGTGIPDHYCLLCYRHFSLKSEPNLNHPRSQIFTWDITGSDITPPSKYYQTPKDVMEMSLAGDGLSSTPCLLCYDSFPLKSEPYLTLPQTPKTRPWRRSHTRYHRTPRAQWKWAQQEADFLANYFLLWSSILNWNQSHISIPTSRPQK